MEAAQFPVQNTSSYVSQNGAHAINTQHDIDRDSIELIHIDIIKSLAGGLKPIQDYFFAHGDDTDRCIAWVQFVMERYESHELLSEAMLYGFAFIRCDKRPWAAVQDGMKRNFWRRAQRTTFEDEVFRTYKELIEPFLPKPPTSQNEAVPLSDYYTALAFVREYGEVFRYCYRWKKWLEWIGTHWQEDVSGAVMRAGKQTIKRLAHQVEGLNDTEAISLMRHIKRSFSTSALQAMLTSAQSEKGIPIQPEELDRDPWLLNCLNGTLDLRTGQLQPHNHTDLITRCISTAYDPDATCPTWDTFLHRVMGGKGIDLSRDTLLPQWLAAMA